jgi:predicted ATPase
MPPETSFVVKRSVAAASLRRLRQRKIHPLFGGYLHLLECAKLRRRLHDLQPDFTDFYKRYFLVRDHPIRTPFIKPFTDRAASDRNLWMNPNVAGSYAPRSLRPGQPFRAVVAVNDESKTYSLPENHAVQALQHLLFGDPLSIDDLVFFLYRDRGFVQGPPVARRLIESFAFEFGYSTRLEDEPSQDFEVLYGRSKGIESNDVLEEVAVDPQAAQQWPGTMLSPALSPGKVRELSATDLLEVSRNDRYERPPLTELSVSGLLSFAETTKFEFGRLSVLVGPNGSGKSNLIDSLRLLSRADRDIQEVFGSSGFESWLYNGQDKRAGKAELQVVVQLPEFDRPLRHTLRLGPPLRSRAQLEEVVEVAGGGEAGELFVGSYHGVATLTAPGFGRRRHVRHLSSAEYNSFQSILSQIKDVRQYPEITRLAEFYSDIRIYSEWCFGRNSKLRDAAPVGRSDPRLSESMDDLPVALNALVGTPAHETIARLLPELKDTYKDFVTRLLFGRVGLELVETSFSPTVPANRLSDGTLRFLALAAILLQPNPAALISIEEPELGMHPDMIRMVAQMIADASARTQLIISTHSELLLTALQEDFDVLYAFDSGPAGTVARHFSQKDFREWRESHSLGELWTSGELGGNRW